MKYKIIKCIVTCVMVAAITSNMAFAADDSFKGSLAYKEFTQEILENE